MAMPDDSNPIAPGAEGTVRSVRRHKTGQNAWLQVDVDWDNGRKLMLAVPPDRFEILSDEPEEER
jgi:hypothetical protein